MNKLSLFLICFFITVSLFGQNTNTTPAVDIAAQDLEIMIMNMESKYPTLGYNQAQKQQLLSVLESRAKEIFALRQQPGLTKDQYSIDYKKIANKYENKLVMIMSPIQKKAYLGNNNSVMKK